MRVASLASGSQGNSVFVESENGDTAFLIDCGLGVVALRERLSLIGKTLNDINFVVLTHEHGDHMRSAETLSQVYNIPVYAHESALHALLKNSKRKLKNLGKFNGFNGFTLGGFDIFPFQNSHDVTTAGYLVNHGGKRFVYATDLGVAGQNLFDAASGADLVMLESNHDYDMLVRGAYPAFLKRRILSPHGHLSNSDAASAISKLLNRGAKNFVLAHLSAENNTPMLALNQTKTALSALGAQEEIDYNITVARQHVPTELIRV
jgi:phosphoribosyl 1,2-cyclic phosphodiesterase